MTQRHVEIGRSWYGRRHETTTYTAGSAPIDGWFLLTDSDRGWVTCSDQPASQGHIRGYEDGRVLILSEAGELSVADYRIEFFKALFAGIRSWETHSLEDRHSASATDLVGFDRLNRAGYRETANRTRRRGRTNAANGEAWRQELGRNWRIGVPNAGMEVSLALKKFNEHGTYWPRLAIVY